MRARQWSSVRDGNEPPLFTGRSYHMLGFGGARALTTQSVEITRIAYEFTEPTDWNTAVGLLASHRSGGTGLETCPTGSDGGGRAGLQGT